MRGGVLVHVAHLRVKGDGGEEGLRRLAGIERVVIIIVPVKIFPVRFVEVQRDGIGRKLFFTTFRVNIEHHLHAHPGGAGADVFHLDDLRDLRAGHDAGFVLKLFGARLVCPFVELDAHTAAGDHVVRRGVRGEVSQRVRREDGEQDGQHRQDHKFSLHSPCSSQKLFLHTPTREINRFSPPYDPRL